MEDARNKMMEKYGRKEVGGIFREYLKKKKEKSVGPLHFIFQ